MSETSTPFNFNPDENSEGLPDAIPYHNACGLPVELCICPDAPVKFDGGGYVDSISNPAPSAARIGETIAINLDVAGGEDEARRLMQSGWKVRVISLETSEIECPACGWGQDKTIAFDCELGAGGEVPVWMQCQGCDHRIELPIEILNMMRRVYDGKI